jgi:hypothetical protein
MAKKKPGKRRRVGFALTVTNVKFVGVAIDEVLSDLKMIKRTARDKTGVQDKIDALQDLHTRASRICPQSWWIPFDSE